MQKVTIIFYLIKLINSQMPAILMDGGYGLTQLYFPMNSTRPSIGRLNYGLPHCYGAVGAMLNDSAYFIGGYCDAKHFSTNVHVVHTRNSSVTMTQNINIARQYASATTYENKIILCGGTTTVLPPYYDCVSSCEEYNVQTQTWKFTLSMPVVLMYHTMITINNKVYSFGGDMCLDRTIDTVFMFDGLNWTERMSSPVLFRLSAGVALNNNQAVLCGGTNAIGCYIYTVSTDTWTNAKPLVEYHWGHCSVVLNGIVLLK
jgi:N-acetylneuraminic acid mutarotase